VEEVQVLLQAQAQAHEVLRVALRAIQAAVLQAEVVQVRQAHEVLRVALRAIQAAVLQAGVAVPVLRVP
jgi:hypothetical protein